MAASTRRQILEAVVARLQVITQQAGYATDAGAHVFLGEAPALGPDDPESALAVIVDEDQVSRTGEHTIIELPLVIAAVVRPDLNAPWLVVEQVLSDIKRAMELPDRSLGRLLQSRMERGSTRTIDRQEGSTTTGTTITYVFPYVEVWGDP